MQVGAEHIALHAALGRAVRQGGLLGQLDEPLELGGGIGGGIGQGDLVGGHLPAGVELLVGTADAVLDDAGDGLTIGDGPVVQGDGVTQVPFQIADAIAHRPSTGAHRLFPTEHAYLFGVVEHAGDAILQAAGQQVVDRTAHTGARVEIRNEAREGIVVAKVNSDDCHVVSPFLSLIFFGLYPLREILKAPLGSVSVSSACPPLCQIALTLRARRLFV